MKNVFVKKDHNIKNIILPVFSFLIAFIAVIFGMNNIKITTDKEEIEFLENAINKSVIHCYATKGQYPESIEYLKKHYALSYDNEKYFVDYQIFASNIMPQVTVIKIKK